MSKEIPKSSKDLLMIPWNWSTTSCGVMPRFFAWRVIGTPCSSEPQTKSTSRPRSLR